MPIQSRKSLQKISATVLIIIIVLWILLAGVRTINNFSKLFTEERAWMGLSDEEKRQKFFGNPYGIISDIQSTTKGKGSVLIVATDGMPYYMARYYLYPQRIYWTTAFIPDKAYDYVVVTDKKYTLIQSKEYILVSNDTAQIYKRI